MFVNSILSYIQTTLQTALESAIKTEIDVGLNGILSTLPINITTCCPPLVELDYALLGNLYFIYVLNFECSRFIAHMHLSMCMIMFILTLFVDDPLLFTDYITFGHVGEFYIVETPAECPGIYCTEQIMPDVSVDDFEIQYMLSDFCLQSASYSFYETGKHNILIYLVKQPHLL